MYGNFHIQSPDGYEMFHCNSQKVLWYLNRDIVDIVSDNPPTVRLRFNPNGLGHVGDSYYLTEKVNQCVVCAATQNLNRHHVMPRVFRRHFPEILKEHNYHDILLMCIDCHDLYEAEAGKFKKKICDELGLKIHSGGHVYLPEIVKVVKAAHALLNNREIPEPRHSFLMNTIKDHLGKQELSEEDLKDCAGLFTHCSEQYLGFGQQVMEKIDDLQLFTERWREHFVSTMNPKYLPEYWDIKKSIGRK